MAPDVPEAGRGPGGAVVLSVAPGSAAAMRGVREGALLEEVNGVPVGARPLAEVLAAFVATVEGAPLRLRLRLPRRATGAEPVLCAELCQIAATRNDAGLLAWTLERGVRPESGALLAAARGLHLAIAQQLVKAGCPWHKGALSGAFSRHGEHAMRFLQWAVARGGAKLDDDDDLGSYVCRKGDATALRWAFEHGCPLPSGCTRAAALGELGLLEEIRATYDNEHENEGIVMAAAENGHDRVLAWAVSKGMRIDETTIEAAAGGGRLGTVQYLRGLGCPWKASAWAASAAAPANSVHLLQWLRYKICPKPDEKEGEDVNAACTAAAENGNLKALRWLREESPPFAWDAATCLAAVSHLDVLKYLRAQDPPCPLSADVCESALESDEYETLRWLKENGCECGGDHHPNENEDDDDD